MGVAYSAKAVAASDDGSPIGWPDMWPWPPGNDDDGNPVLPPAWEMEFVPALPSTVVVNEACVITIEAQIGGEINTAYDGDGSGVTLASYVGDTDDWTSTTNLVQADGSAIDLTTGWSNGVWTQSVKLTDSDLSPKVKVTATYEATENSDTADVEERYLVPILPVTPIAVDTPFSLNIEARDINGAVATTYDKDGAGLVLETYLETGAVRTPTTNLVLADGNPIDITTGWTAGVWTASVKLTDSGGQDTLVVSVTNGSDVQTDTVAIESTVFVPILPEYLLPRNGAFDLTIEARDGEEVVTDYSGNGAGLVLTAAIKSNFGYTSTLGLVQANDSPIDLTTGWTAGVWTQSVKLTGAAAQDLALRVTVTVGSDAESDEEDLVDLTLLQAMNERQLAFGHMGYDLVDTTGETGYSMEELIDIASWDIADMVVKDGYAGGLGVPEEYDAEEYMTGVTTQTELLEKVKPLRITWFWSDVTPGEGVAVIKRGESSPQSDLVAAKAEAVSNYAIVESCPDSRYWREAQIVAEWDGDESAWMYTTVVRSFANTWQSGVVETCFPEATTNCYVDVYCRYVVYDLGAPVEVSAKTFDKHDDNSVTDENVHVLVERVTPDANREFTLTSPYPQPSLDIPTHWPELTEDMEPGTVYGMVSGHGASFYYLITWTFAIQ